MAATADTYVLDASVAVKWYLQDEQHARQAALLLERYGRGELYMVAPDHIRYEVPSAIAVATLGTNPRIAVQQGQQAIEQFLALRLITVDTNELIVAAFPLVHQFAIALYDALYVALALLLTHPFVTADRKLYDRISHLPIAVWITDPRLQR